MEKNKNEETEYEKVKQKTLGSIKTKHNTNNRGGKIMYKKWHI